MDTILFINPAGYIGGAEKSLLDLTANLPSERFQARVVLFSAGPLEAELRARGIACEVIPLSPILLGFSRSGEGKSRRWLPIAPLLVLPTVFQLAGLIRDRGSTIVQTNGIKAHLLGGVAARLAGRPLVWHFRDLPEAGLWSHLWRGTGRILPNRIIANSLAVKKQLGDLARIRVVYNGVAVPESGGEVQRREARRQLGLEESEIAIGTIGHFAPLKGYEDFLAAIPAIREKIPAARFLITGEAIYPAHRDYRRQLEIEAERRGLARTLVFTGPRRDPGEILAALDIFVLPSRSEGFGRANLEAMAAGLPVVSTRVGGIPEVVIDGETGILVEPCDPAALAQAVIALAEDPALRERLGQAGKKRANKFSIPQMVRGVTAVYDEILEST